MVEESWQMYISLPGSNIISVAIGKVKYPDPVTATLKLLLFTKVLSK